jgi:hypothetical protein
MNRRFFVLLLIPVLLISCSEEKRKLLRRGKKRANDFVLEMQHFFSESEENMSFPVWFDDSLIRENKIKEVSRKIFVANGKVDDFASLKTEKRYSFDEKGRVTSVQVTEYYEGQKISDVTFTYSGVKDVHGFQKVKMTKSKVSDIDLTGYQFYETEQLASNFLAYVNTESGNYLFYLPNEKYWGALSVDSILSPTEQDVVVYGTPKWPRKRYNVENRVNQSNVREVEYAVKTNNPIEITFEREPFDYKRTIEYDKQGNCIGFVDSTFSMERFLMRRHSKFQFENNALPVRLTHTSAQTANSEKNLQIETFDYTYYE